MGATYIKDIPEADHQHLQPQEREQEFVEEENYMAETELFPLTPEDFRTHIPERIQKSEKILEDIRTREQDIQRREKILEDIRTREQERIQKIEKIQEDIRICVQESIQKIEKIQEDIRICVQESIQKIEKILEDIGTWEQDIQRRENKTTKTTISRHSTITYLLLGSVYFASRFCSVGAEFIPVKSDLSLCKTDLSKLADTCDHYEGNAIQCVLNDEGELGIGCFSKIWVKQGYCPYFRKYFGVLDIRPCLGNSSICPTDRDQYLSNEVYKYPGCLTYKSARVLDALKTLNTSSTAIRSSDVGDGKYIRPLWILLTLFVLSPIIIF